MYSIHKFYLERVLELTVDVRDPFFNLSYRRCVLISEIITNRSDDKIQSVFYFISACNVLKLFLNSVAVLSYRQSVGFDDDAHVTASLYELQRRDAQHLMTTLALTNQKAC